MPRPNKWKLGFFKEVKLKLSHQLLERYQKILKLQNKTMQEDFEDHVKKLTNY